MAVILENGNCGRCKENPRGEGKCRNCGVAFNGRPTVKSRRRAKIGGKRGHTSGKVGSAKKR